MFRARVAAGTLDERVEVSFPFPHVERPRNVTVRLRSFVVGGEAHALLLVENISMQRAVERLKESLATLLVHDMKNPLSVITASLGFVGHQLPARADLRDAVSEGVAAASRLNGMILNLLDVTRLETGTFPLDPAPMDLAGVRARNRHGPHPRGPRATSPSSPTPPPWCPRWSTAPSCGGCSTTSSTTRSVTRRSTGGWWCRRGPRAAAPSSTSATRAPACRKNSRTACLRKYVQVGGGRAQGMNRGLGLTFVRMAAHAHGGEAAVVSSSPRGATFRLSLPDLPR